MPVTTYQAIIKSRLDQMFRERPLYTETLFLDYTERNFIVELCILNNYCPVFGYPVNGYCAFNAISLYYPQ